MHRDAVEQVDLLVHCYHRKKASSSQVLRKWFLLSLHLNGNVLNYRMGIPVCSVVGKPIWLKPYINTKCHRPSMIPEDMRLPDVRNNNTFSHIYTAYASHPQNRQPAISYTHTHTHVSCRTACVGMIFSVYMNMCLCMCWNHFLAFYARWNVKSAYVCCVWLFQSY